MSGGLGTIIGASPAMQRANALVQRFAQTELPILLVGATGTGKELFAHHIHQASRRRGEFVDVNCGALPQEIAESLLFGHRRGAFTGAVESVSGYFERADAGTVFLDEVADLPLQVQTKLLRVLETGEVVPLGPWAKRHVSTRLVAAAQTDLLERVEGGAFRLDLFQRMAGVVISLPSLIERPEDIIPLATHFAATRGQVLQGAAMSVLLEYTWPGNVRELRFVIERARHLVEDDVLSAQAVRDAMLLGCAPVGSVNQTESGFVQKVITAGLEHGWTSALIASALQIDRATLFRRLKGEGVSLRALAKSQESRDSRATNATSSTMEPPYVVRNSLPLRLIAQSR